MNTAGREVTAGPGTGVPAGTYTRGPAVLWRALDDRTLLLGREGDEVVSLMGAAADLWEVLAEPTEASEAVELLARAYGMADAEVASALAPVLLDLLRRDFVARGQEG
jgi:hypothetical protein